MKQSDTNDFEAVAISATISTTPEAPKPTDEPAIARRPYVPEDSKRKASLKNKSAVIFLGALVAVVLILLALTPVLRRSTSNALKLKTSNFGQRSVAQSSGNVSEATGSIVPLTETGQANKTEPESSAVHPEQIAGTANHGQDRTTATKLGDIRPFDNRAWEPPPYQPGAENRGTDVEAAPANTSETTSEREAMDKPSLVFVRSKSTDPTQVVKTESVSMPIELSLGLAPGTRLRARLEAAVSTAVQTPVVAVIEYNYERDGAITVPAGTKAFGHLESADRSGYLGVRFDSMQLPDGSNVGLDAAATDLDLRPLKGKVEGKHTGKNIMARSVAGIGEIAATIVARGSLNHPLSEGDLVRERVSNNIGQASDEEIARLQITERLVVSVPANKEILVVLQKPTKNIARGISTSESTQPTSRTATVEELRQLLQLQRELNQSANVSTSNAQ